MDPVILDSPAPPAQPHVQVTTGVLTDLIANTAAPIATQAAQQVANNAVAAVNQTINQVQGDITNTVNGLINDHKAQVQAQIQDIAAKVIANAETDPVTERILIVAVLSTLLIAGLVVLVAALMGNATANHYIAAVAVLLGAPLLSILKTGIPISQVVANKVNPK